MISVRKGVFETNSSSTHSLSLEYRTNFDYAMAKLPKCDELQYFDILSYPLKQDGYAVDEISKLRILVSLITECIYKEHYDKCFAEAKEKFNLSNERWEYYFKKRETSAARNFVFKHRYWSYLNTYLKKNYNLNIRLYDILGHFPYISMPVDYEQGCESSDYYREVGFKKNMDRELFLRVVKEVMDESRIISQSCYRD